VFIVEQRPWLGIWLTEYVFSGIRGEATKRIGERCLDYATDGLACRAEAEQANGSDGRRWLRRAARCATTLTRDRGDRRTFSTLKNSQHSFPPPSFGEPRRIKSRLFALARVRSEQASSSMSLIVHSADKQVKGKFDLFSFSQEEERKLVRGQCQPYWTNISAHTSYLSLTPLTALV